MERVLGSGGVGGLRGRRAGARGAAFQRRGLRHPGTYLLLLHLTLGCGPADDLGEPGGQDAPLERIQVTVPSCGELGRGTPGPLQVDTLATGLEVVWDLAFLPDGRILVVERPGRVRLVDESGLRQEPWAELPVAATAEAGLLGIDIDPDFAETGHVFVAYTGLDLPSGRIARLADALLRRLRGAMGRDDASAWRNRVVRFTDQGSTGGDPREIIGGIPSGPTHAGGALRFGPEGLLHLGVGDGGHLAAASRWDSWRGSILRFSKDGSPAPGMDGVDSPVAAVGLRNPQGIAWDTGSGRGLVIEHGPTGLEPEGYRRDKDELNLFRPGADYGWPEVAGMWVGGGFDPPLLEWTPAIAPSGIAIAEAPGHLWDRNVFVTGLVGRQLRRVVLRWERLNDLPPAGSLVICEESLLHGTYGRLRAIRSGPDSAIYLGTSNRDQRGVPRPGDDLLLRVSLP